MVPPFEILVNAKIVTTLKTRRITYTHKCKENFT